MYEQPLPAITVGEEHAPTLCLVRDEAGRYATQPHETTFAESLVYVSRVASVIAGRKCAHRVGRAVVRLFGCLLKPYTANVSAERVERKARFLVQWFIAHCHRHCVDYADQ